MKKDSRWLLQGGLMISSALLLGSLLLTWQGGGWSVSTSYLHRCAQEMRELSPVVMFIAVFGSAWWEERLRKIEAT